MIIGSLGMTGRFLYTEDKHSHLKFDIIDKENNEIFGLYFDDSRLFGNLEIINKSQEKEYFSKLGPDLLSFAIDENTWISSEEWKKIFNSKKMGRKKICDILTDQSLVAGIGWYLMTEILYFSKVQPLRLGNTITTEELERIRIEAHRITALSYKHGGFTIENYLSPSGKKGLYPATIYGKKIDPNNYKVINEKHKQRTVHYVAEIQI
jgi:formamidopyrimidine-DNA glycosylase